MNRLATMAMRWGAFFMCTGVMLGAFAAHRLKYMVSERYYEAFLTGVHYQLLHGIALLVLPLIALSLGKTKILSCALWLWLGTVLFSFSLYLLAISQKTFFAYLTPVGGLALIVGWGYLLFLLFQNKPLK